MPSISQSTPSRPSSRFHTNTNTGLGALYALLLWAVRVRKVPTIAKPEMKTLSILGLLHAVSHITAITSLGAGAVR